MPLPAPFAPLVPACRRQGRGRPRLAPPSMGTWTASPCIAVCPSRPRPFPSSHTRALDPPRTMEFSTAATHAEATSHTNFAESTEAVLNLVCADCGKPCRPSVDLASPFPPRNRRIGGFR
ncbi:hypothetical protein ZWY2020_053576 [Hordeum vulgare]|nr:hypothetical protein ZWY2020_053576 [Hordeum vulgare]